MYPKFRTFILSVCVSGCFLFAPPRAEAGMLGDLWNSVVGFFTGKKKPDAQAEAQIKAALEATNESQNAVIASINEIVTYQNQLESLNNPEDKKKLDQMMESMQASVEANQKTYMQLIQIQEQLNQAGMGKEYEANFAPYVQKQQEIEQYYPKIEDRYNELAAFSQDNSQEGESTDTATAGVDESWNKPEVQALIDEYLAANNLDIWGGPKVDGVKVGRPIIAGSRGRYQYVYESSSKIRDFIAGKIGKENSNTESQGAGQTVQAKTNATTKAEVKAEVVANPAAPASPGNSSVSTPKKKKVIMGFRNNYDNVSLRAQRDEIFKKLNALNKEGKMNSEEYKDLYLEYTKLNDKIRQAGQ